MAKQRLDATISIGSVLERSVGKNLNLIRRGLDGVGDEIKKVTDRQKELSKQRKVLERQGQSVDALDREYEQLGRTLDDLRRKQERFERAQGAANRVGRQFGEMNRQVGRQVRNAGIAIGAASAAIFGVASSTAAAGDELAKQSRALGFNVEAYQELGYAAERSGVSAEVFNSSMTAMSKRLGEAAQGQGAAKKALDELGLSAQDLIEMEPDEALGVIAERMQDIDDPARKAAFAAAIFSRSGIRMTNMLNEGSDGIDALRNRARELGLVLSEDATADSEAFQDSLLNAQSALSGMKNIIGAELIPAVGDMMDKFTEFVVNNQPQIKQFGETLAEMIKGIDFEKLFSDIDGFFTKIGNVTDKLEEMGIGWSEIGIAIGAVMASPAIVAVGGFVVTVGKLAGALTQILIPAINGVGRAFLLNPIGLAIAGIAAGAYLIYENWGSVKDWFSDLWGSVTDIFGGFGDFVGSVFTGDMSGAVDGLKRSWEGVTGVFDSILTGIGGTFTAVWTDLIKPVTDKLGLTEPIVSAWNAARDGIGSAMTWVGDKLTEVKDTYVTPFISLMSDGLSGIAGAWQGVRDAIGGVLDWITEKFATVMDKIKPVIEALTWVRDQGAGAVGAVTGFFGGDAGPSGGSGGSRRQRAIGGALSANVPTLVGERGPEIIYPNQGGFVAHDRAVERLAQLSAQARTGIGSANENAMPNVGRLASEIGSIGRAVAAAAGAMVATSMEPAQAAPQIVPVMQKAAPVQVLDFTPPPSEPLEMPQPAVRSGDTIQQQGARSASVVQNITINAPQNMDVQQLVAELERLKSLAQNDALFDGANDWGQYA